MRLAVIIAAPFAVIFLGGAAAIWWACERFFAFIRKADDNEGAP